LGGVHTCRSSGVNVTITIFGDFRLFSAVKIVFFSEKQIFETDRSSANFSPIFSRGTGYMYVCVELEQNTAWATFWAIFPQTNLVTMQEDKKESWTD
jgi:hypothetical protein